MILEFNCVIKLSHSLRPKDFDPCTYTRGKGEGRGVGAGCYDGHQRIVYFSYFFIFLKKYELDI